MKKQVMAVILALAATVSMGTVFAGTVMAAADFGVDAEFDPNPDYDKYTVVEYTIEALNADIVATVSAKEDDSEFEILCNFFGEDQKAVVTYDGSEFTCTEDKTGFLNGDAPDILKAALEQDQWAPIGGDAAEAAVEDTASDYAGPDITQLDYQPKEEYDYFTVTDFDIESMGQTLEIVVSKKEGDQEYNLQMYFFGGDADVDVAVDDDGNYTVTNDGGFFQTEGPLVVQQAEEEDDWYLISDAYAAAAGEESKDGEAAAGEAVDADNSGYAGPDITQLDYQPKEGYDYFTVTDFDIESMGQTLEIVVSKKEGNQEYNLQMYFFGGDADVDVAVDGDGNYTVTNDGGFFQTEGPLVVQQVEEEDNWYSISEAYAAAN